MGGGTGGDAAPPPRRFPEGGRSLGEKTSCFNQYCTMLALLYTSVMKQICLVDRYFTWNNGRLSNVQLQVK